ncbi:MAG: hypothetical protein N4A33_05360 [Bacteriovoracaceae bacterium]|jgi:hypothetical protein|nr:hypothetical protein [Bacteriovoracaceae bacterium]
MKIVLVLSIFIANFSHAGTVWDYVNKRMERKEFKRWTLGSWFQSKQEYGLQNQWLVLNTDNSGLAVEFYTDYAKTKFDNDTNDNDTTKTDGFSSETALYIAFLGFSYRYEDYDFYDQKEYAVNLRLIGSSHQTTHLILSYGKRDFEDDVNGTFEQSFYGADISLYLVSFLGFDARYRIYDRELNNEKTYEMSSKRFQWGGFIELNFLRLFVYQFEEDLDIKQLGVGNSKQQIKGTAFGARVYF